MRWANSLGSSWAVSGVLVMATRHERYLRRMEQSLARAAAHIAASRHSLHCLEFSLAAGRRQIICRFLASLSFHHLCVSRHLQQVVKAEGGEPIWKIMFIEGRAEGSGAYFSSRRGAGRLGHQAVPTRWTSTWCDQSLHRPVPIMPIVKPCKIAGGLIARSEHSRCEITDRRQSNRPQMFHFPRGQPVSVASAR